MPIDVRIPLAPDETGTIGVINAYEESVKQQIKNIVLTNPGERLYDSNYGVGLGRMIFDPRSEFTLEQVKSRITNQIKTYAPFVDLIDVKAANLEEDENSIYVLIEYSINSISNYTDVLELNFSNTTTI